MRTELLPAGQTRLFSSLAAALLLASTLPAVAQDTVPARTGASGQTLQQRMDALLAELQRGGVRSAAEFFPRSGDWTWVRTTRRGDGSEHVGVWRFGAADTPGAMKTCGPVWESFEMQHHGQPMGVLVHQVMEHGTGWRRGRGNRFVPPASARSAAFVEWRREDGEWVISAFGDERHGGPRLPGTIHGMIMRDTTLPLPAEDVYAVGERWYEANEPVTFEGFRYIKYGVPRPLERHQLARVGTLGRIRVFTERGHTAVPAVIYIPTSAGTYQPYEGFRMCR